ncbi:hypothetical protein [Clostridium sp. 19966]|uniref:hypothetical protein n=1 Tax=Clostridium sp. 19966 TaxID=2768166 RepID=UPI0028EC412B|nr:hypothetical protein [Clostridium sp. 19966]
MATDRNCCMGLLTASQEYNLLDARAWSKNQYPVLDTNIEDKIFDQDIIVSLFQKMEWKIFQYIMPGTIGI